MTVKVPFQLRRRDVGVPAAATALFVPGRDAAALFALCTRLGLDPTGRIHDVAGGFLLKLGTPTAGPVPGATRLRELATDLFIPVDAELVPSLLDDEAAGLVRDGGLVLLPGGPVLRFDREATLGLEALLTTPRRPRREWRPMPEPRPLAERVVEIARQWPEPPPDDLYREWEQELRAPRRSRPASRQPDGPRQGEANHGEASARPEGAGTGAAEGVTSGRQGLGDTLRDLIGRAGAGARSLGEKIQWGMTDHSTLVQKLLREFRHGDTGRALRHAFSMAPSDPRNRNVWWGNDLPWSRAIYNLFDLLGTPSRGQSVGVWQARPDLLDELKREYRKAAEQAVRQGDFRRAAYIYGKLLGDDRTAAQALQRGGLHQDAAIIYLRKVNDRAEAARAFEAAGHIDRAIALYRELGQHEAAGDLLRRIGDDEAAVREYQRAAFVAATSMPGDHYHAGLVLLNKAGMPEPAIEHFRLGWVHRPAANAAACALELTLIHATRGEIEPIRNLLDEADAFFKSAGSARDAEGFYNRTAVIASAAPALASSAEEVRDRALLALSHHLRRQVEAGSPAGPAASSLFGEPSLWSSAFVRDAQFAAAAVAGRPRDRAAADTREPEPAGVQVGRGTVRAACQASATAELFLGFADGKVLAFRAGRNQVVRVGEVPGGVASLVAEPDGQVVFAALHRNEHGSVLTGFLRRPDGTFRPLHDVHFPGDLRTWLTPFFAGGAEPLIGLGTGRELSVLHSASLLPLGRVPLAVDEEQLTTAVLLPDGDSFRVLSHDGSRWILLDREGRRLGSAPASCRPLGGGRHPRCAIPMGCMALEGVVKLIGLDEHGAVYAAQLWIEDGGFELLSSPAATTDGGYLAAAPCGHGKVVAVSASRIDWLSDRNDRFQVARSIQNPGLGATAACFPSMVSDEVLVVFVDGWVARYTSRRPRA